MDDLSPIVCKLVNHPNDLCIVLFDPPVHPRITFDQLKNYVNKCHRQNCGCGGALGEIRIGVHRKVRDEEDILEDFSRLTIAKESDLVEIHPDTPDYIPTTIWIQVESYDMPGSCAISGITRQATKHWVSKMKCHLPSSDTSFLEFKDTPGLIFIDKTSYIPYFDSQVPIVIRPARFGKTAFVSMLCAYHDIRMADNFNSHFLSSDITNPDELYAVPRPPNQLLVLSYDLNTIVVTCTPDISYRRSMESQFISILRRFMDDYMSVLSITPEECDHVCNTRFSADYVFSRVMSIVRRSGHRVFVAVDNYDAPTRWNIPDSSGFIDTVLFYGIFKSLGVIADGIMTGTCPDGNTVVDPCQVCYTSTLAQYCRDVTWKEEVRHAFGISYFEATELIDTLGGNYDQANYALGQIEEKCACCSFYEDGEIVHQTFRPQDVFDVLRKLFPEMKTHRPVPVVLHGMLDPERAAARTTVKQVEPGLLPNIAEEDTYGENEDILSECEVRFAEDDDRRCDTPPFLDEDLFDEMPQDECISQPWSENSFRIPPSPSNSSSSKSTKSLSTQSSISKII